jgi:hypothetical protein
MQKVSVPRASVSFQGIREVAGGQLPRNIGLAHALLKPFIK